jgi:hypothetical protein
MTGHTTIEQFKLPWLLRAINWVGDRLGERGSSLIVLSEESLMAAAEQYTKLSDWGDEDFRPQFRMLLGAYNNHADLSLIGRYIVRMIFIRMLINRLRIQDTLKRHPDILAIPLRRPLFIVGFTRTGTTLLHNLLAQDPSARVPWNWELLFPCPLVVGQPSSQDPRRRRIQMSNRFIPLLMPSLRTIHFSDALDPDECIILFQNQFIDFFPVGFTGDFPYYDWLMNHDMIPDYRYYRRQLQLLLSRQFGEPWVLKSPCHLSWLDALLNVFPDANIVWTHRDPQKVMPSMCSLAAAYRKIGSDRVDLKQLGARVLTWLETSSGRALKVRDSANPAQFFDVDYHDLIANPMEMVRRIYERFSYSYTPAMEQGMKRWLDDHPQNKYGVHHYSLDTFGLNRDDINHRFADYVTRFNVRPE